MTLQACVTKWSGEAETLRRVGAHVDGAKLIEAILTDIQAASCAETSDA